MPWHEILCTLVIILSFFSQELIILGWPYLLTWVGTLTSYWSVWSLLLHVCDNLSLETFICTEISQANGGNDIEEAVITAPLHFSNEQKTEIRWINQLLISRSKIEVLKLYGIRWRAHIHIHWNCLDFMLCLYNFKCIM